MPDILLSSETKQEETPKQETHDLDPQQPFALDPAAGLAAARRMLTGIPFSPARPVLEKWLAQDLTRLYRSFGDSQTALFSTLLDRLGVTYDCSDSDLARIPAKGPVIVVANHPFGLADGAVIAALLARVRPDVRLLANSMLAAVPALTPHIIPVDVIPDVGHVYRPLPKGQRPSLARNNFASLRRSLQWLRAGGLLVVFPAGEVASLQFGGVRPQFSGSKSQFGGAESQAPGIRDIEWNPNAVRLAQLSGSTIVPVYFHGNNSPAFHLAGMVNPQWRTLLLPHELLNKTGTRIPVSIGAPISAQRFSRAHQPPQQLVDAARYLRARTDVLRYRKAPEPKRANWFASRFAVQARIASAADPSVLCQEIAALPAEQCLLQQAENQVWIASGPQIPAILHEIGRLREIAFRHVGEGTGSALDLDRFDDHYQHLFIWNAERSEVAGAYRLAALDDVMRTHGPGGLYTGTLFHLRREFYDAIHPAIELGRSFVCVEYQKSYQALLLLWKGLGHYVARNPRYRILFGPVSISKEYSEPSRALIATYLRERHTNPNLARFVRPRKKLKVRPVADCGAQSFASLLSNLDDLSAVIADMEPDRKGLPILLQHYLNLGGQILDFSVDKKFSSVLDGLIVVDLPKTGRRSLERYMGKTSAHDYLARHKSHLVG